MGRTIGRHLPASFRRGDCVALCDYCGVPYYRSQLRIDGAGFFACPDDSKGTDAVTLSKEVAALDSAQPHITTPSGRVDKGGSEYKSNPVSILGTSLVGWWALPGADVAGGLDAWMNYFGNDDFDRGAILGLGFYASLEGVDYTAQQWVEYLNGTRKTPSYSPDRSGVTAWRNLAKRYNSSGQESQDTYKRGIGDLYSYGLFAPSFEDSVIRYDSYFSVGEGGGSFATRRLYTVSQNKMMASGTNPCMWVVFKPYANVYTDSSDPNDNGGYCALCALRRGHIHPFASDNNDEIMSIMWGNTKSGSVSAYKKWQARCCYTTAGDTRSLGPSTLNEDQSRRIYSVRMEDDQLVFKVSDTEYTQSITSGDSLKYDMYSMAVGDFVNGEISEVIISSSVPTDSEITQIEQYLKRAHTDIVETL